MPLCLLVDVGLAPVVLGRVRDAPAARLGLLEAAGQAAQHLAFEDEVAAMAGVGDVGLGASLGVGLGASLGVGLGASLGVG